MMERKRILYICTEAATGMISYATGIIMAASKSIFLDVYAITVDDEKLSYRPYLNNFPAEKIRFLKIPEKKIPKYSFKLFARTILKQIDEMCKNQPMDVIHFLTIEYVCANILPQLKKRGKVYYTIHDFVPHEKAYTGIKDFLFSQFMRWSVKRNIRRADYLVTNSGHQQKLIAAKYPQKTLFFHFFPPLITDSILNGEKVCPELTGINNYILFFGNIDIYKGVEYLYEGYKSNPNLKDYYLVIAGRGGIYFPHDDDRRILFLNRHIGDEEVKSLFTGAKCVVFPYISATQSGVLTLTYRFQTPVLVSDIPFFREVSNDGCCMFFERANARDLSAKLECLLFETDLVAMKAAQKDYFERHYTESGITASIEQIY